MGKMRINIVLLLAILLVVSRAFAECPPSIITIHPGKQVIELAEDDVCEGDVSIVSGDDYPANSYPKYVVFDCNGAELDGTLYIGFLYENSRVVVKNCNFRGKPAFTGTGLSFTGAGVAYEDMFEDRNVEFIIENNTFSGLEKGIDSVFGLMLIKNNLFQNNEYAIGDARSDLGVRITKNRFENNKYSFKSIIANFQYCGIWPGGEIAGNYFDGGWLVYTDDPAGFWAPFATTISTKQDFDKFKIKFNFPDYSSFVSPMCMTGNEYSHMAGFVRHASYFEGYYYRSVGEFDFGCPFYRKHSAECKCPGNLPGKIEPAQDSVKSESAKTYILDCNGLPYHKDLYLSGCYDRVIIKNCKFSKPISIWWARDIEILNNTFYESPIGIKGVGAGQFGNIRIANNKFENRLYGIDLISGVGNKVELLNNEFLGNVRGIREIIGRFGDLNYKTLMPAGGLFVLNNKFANLDCNKHDHFCKFKESEGWQGIGRISEFPYPECTGKPFLVALNNVFSDDSNKNVHTNQYRAFGIGAVALQDFAIRRNEFRNLDSAIGTLGGAEMTNAIYSDNTFKDVVEIGFAPYDPDAYGYSNVFCGHPLNKEPLQTIPRKDTLLGGRFGGIYDPERCSMPPGDLVWCCFSDNNVYIHGKQVLMAPNMLHFPDASIGWFPFGCYPAGDTFLDQHCLCKPGKEKKNHSPKAVFTAVPREGFVPLTVDFDASNSSDPDGDALSYYWTFSDRTSTKSIPKFALAFTSLQPIDVTLEVRDPSGLSDSVTRKVYPYTHVSIIEVRAKDVYEGEKTSVEVNCTLDFDVNVSIFKEKPHSSLTVVKDVLYPCNSGFVSLGPGLKEGIYLVNAKTKIRNCSKCLESTHFVVRKKVPHTSTPETQPVLVALVGIIVLMVSGKRRIE